MPIFLRRHRRAIAFILAFLGVLVALSSLRERPEVWTAVVAAGDLSPGQVLAEGDLRTVPMTVAARPDTAVDDPAAVVGRVLAGPVAAGEMLLESRLVGPSLLAGSPDDHVAMSVRLDDPAEAAFLRPGDIVDVLAAARTTGLASSTDPGAADGGEPAVGARVVAQAVRVLAVPGVAGAEASGLLGSSSVGSGQGTVIVVGVPGRTAASIAGVAAGARMSVVLRAQ